jgi:ATP-dependent RNA helicase RhlE
LADFKKGDLQVLVATDIAARGIDIDELPHVVNFELPNVPEDYVHRIGRTGRAGSSGEAISLVCVDEEEFLTGIERLIKQKVARETIAGFEPHSSEKPEPIVLGRRMVIGAGAGRGGSSRPSGSGGRPGGGGGGGGGHSRPDSRNAPAARPPRNDSRAPAGTGAPSHSAPRSNTGGRPGGSTNARPASGAGPASTAAPRRRPR